MATFITKDAYFKLDKVKVTKYASIREGKGGAGPVNKKCNSTQQSATLAGMV
jgi:hypothetical protein